ncbi:MAG: efflux RND transporter permease subunit [Burkholderiales bacterium]|nr:efflux RND transporter permease subunit [Burkholderiales bacterium]
MVDILRRPIIWLLIYGGLLAYGLYALLHIPVEVLPRFNYPQISVIAHFSGATPEEMETLIARPIEGQLLGIPNLDSLRAVMGQGTVQLNARFREGSNAQPDLQSVYGAIDRARSGLPPGVQPYAEIMGNAVNEVADYMLQIPDNVSPMLVQREVETRILPAIRALPGVQRVLVFGSGHESFWVQPDPVAMRHYGIDFPEIAAMLKKYVTLGPAGYMVLGHQDIFLEMHALPDAEVLSNIPLPVKSGVIPLRTVARVIHGPEPAHYTVDLDGHSSIAMVVFKQPGASTMPVTRTVANTLKTLSGQLPSGVHWVRIYDQGHLVHLIGSDLGRNLLVGGILAIAVLFWLLGTHRGVWVLALSIPMALLMGIAGLYAFGQSLNLLTLGALSVAVGLLADDGIIVLESIYRRWEAGEGVVGVWYGLRDIASPDISGTLTTVSVFLPLLFVGGIAGLFFIPFALAMSLSLLASLFISLSLIPVLLAFMNPNHDPSPAPGAQFLAWLEHWNGKLLNTTLQHPRKTLGAAVFTFFLGMAAMALVSVNFLPLPNEGVLLVSFTLPPGSSLEDSEAAVTKMTDELHHDKAVDHIYTRIGSAETTSYSERSFAGEMSITLRSDIQVSALDQIADRILREIRQPGVQVSIDTPTIERVGESLSGLPQPFVLTVFGPKLDELRQLAREIVTRLKHNGALTDIFNNDAYPVTQLSITPNALALASYGLTPVELYAQIKPALNGETIATIPKDNYGIDVYMRLADAPHISLNALRSMSIKTKGGWTPLGELASLRLVASPNQIRHIDGARAVDILATPTGPLGTTITKAHEALTGLSVPQGYRFSFGGLFPQLEDAALALGLAAIGALVLILGILVLQFDGLLIPLVLLIEMPLALGGGALALGLSGIGMNATGLVGFLTLVGVSLNHGIVLLHKARNAEKNGRDCESAVREAVSLRFRPIVLTTLTAVLGMLPTALGWGLGAQPEQALAVVILGGILWTSLLSTNLIPALYLHWNRKRSVLNKL